ncbi:acyl-ACP desaturase [Candidatus Uhrbacteria bacterium]|nr:acyl-ACP desaturase [Candidatus Uhrbacteria bacterium]
MLFAQESDALAWYEREPRVLTPAFIATIPWQEVAQHPLHPDCVPVLRYMRDVEHFTGMYYAELLRTPTGREPIIRRFMDRWSTEEPTHGELLHRFLGEAGCPVDDHWPGTAAAAIPHRYHLMSRLSSLLAWSVGRHFSAVHMTWGAINELSTLTGYLRLWQLAKHPVLERILRAIAREEARHAFFYWSIARLKLLRSTFRQQLTRTIVRSFWAPVGEGAKPRSDANFVIATLFRGSDGVATFHRNVNQRIEELPGLSGLRTMTNRVRHVAR